ncbi:MAG: hypothetical protein ACTHMD_19785, partial [Flavisolibacter sp.]
MRIFLVLFFISLANLLSAQVIRGLYSGRLTNDSTKKEQRYELALSEYRGKITGYSYTTFVRNDSLFYGVKRVKATRKDGQLVVEDDKMIVNNFPESPAKGVHQTNYIQLTNEDTLRTANGTWKTNRTKIYYALSGGVEMKLENDSTHSALIAQLKELNIISQPKYADAIVKTKTKENKVKTEIEKPKKETVKTTIAEGKPTNVVAAKNEVVPVPYTERKTRPLQTIELSADSLQLSFYDNGVIDGDSISVYVNGENIISNNRLTATATKKTIKLPDVETIEIILVAEN